LVKTKSASTAETQSLLDAHPQAVVLDVRSATEYAGGHVPGAINVAYTRLVPRIDELSQDADYLVHCGSGVRAAYACSLLERLGRRVVYLNGPVADVLEATGTTSAEPGYSVTPT
jgi:hydroxyacylglutathione hydrolase